GRLRVGAELGRGRPQGVGGLERVPALEAPAAVRALADVDVEPAMSGPARDLDLVLLIDVGFLDRAATTGTTGAVLRQGGFVDLVDALGRWAVRLGAVVRAGLATRLLRVRRGRAFGEGCCLPFAGPLLHFEQSGQPLDLESQVGDAASERLATGQSSSPMRA